MNSQTYSMIVWATLILGLWCHAGILNEFFGSSYLPNQDPNGYSSMVAIIYGIPLLAISFGLSVRKALKNKTKLTNLNVTIPGVIILSWVVMFVVALFL